MVQRRRFRKARPRRRRAKAGLLLAVCTVPLLGACGHSGAPRGVSLLPGSGRSGTAWDWTAACQTQAGTASGCLASGPNLGSGQLDANLWNLGGGAATRGGVGMSVSSSGAWGVKGDLAAAPPCTVSTCVASSANTWVRGYPSVVYGINQCHAGASPPVSPALPLPASVQSIPSDLIGTTTYSSQTPQATYDIAYDMWLSTSGTKTPCQTNGTVEIMVWTDYDAKALLPAGMKVGDASVPFAVNGTTDPGDQAWSVYASNVFPGGRTAPWGGTVWLVLNPTRIVSQGKVSVDLSAALGSVGTLLHDNYGWRPFASTYWLDTIAFGMEFGPPSGDAYDAGAARFSLNLTSYCLGVQTQVSKPAC